MIIYVILLLILFQKSFMAIPADTIDAMMIANKLAKILGSI